MFSGNKRTMYFKIENVIERVQSNRQKHGDEYQELVKKFQEAYKEELQKKIASIDSNGIPELGSQLERPFEYLKDYDRVLDMLKMTTQEEIELSGEEFGMYMRDEWDWKHAFDNTKTNYGM